MFLKISQNSPENTCARASFLIKFPGSATLLKKRIWHRFFPVNLAKCLGTPFIIEHLWWLLLKDWGNISNFWTTFVGTYLASIYLFKVKNRSIRKRCEICLKLATKTPEQRQWRHSVFFIVNFGHISVPFSSVFIVDFEQVNVSWVYIISWVTGKNIIKYLSGFLKFLNLKNLQNQKI